MHSNRSAAILVASVFFLSVDATILTATASGANPVKGAAETVYAQILDLDLELRTELQNILEDRALQDLRRRATDSEAAEDTTPQGGARVVRLRELETRLDGLRLQAAALEPAALRELRSKLLSLELGLRNLALMLDTGEVPPSPHPAATSDRQPAREVAPANDDCASATVIGNGSFLSDTTEATNDGSASCGASAGAPDVWFKYVAPSSGLVVVDTFGSGYDTVLSSHSSCPGTTANELACNDDSGSLQSSISLGLLNAGDEVWIRVSGYNGSTGAVNLNVGPGTGISGHVSEEGTGSPVSSLVILRDDSGFSRGFDATDSSGFYEIVGAPAGTYFAMTRNSGALVDELYDDLICVGGLACDPTTGTPLSLSAGTILTGVDFALAQGGTISGTITDAGSGTPLGGIDLDVFDTQGRFLPIRNPFTATDGTYTAVGLPTGDYFVVADPSNSQGYADELYDNIPCSGCNPTTGTPVSVTSPADTSGIDFALAPGGSISGTITEESSGNPLAGIDLDVFDAAGNFISVSPNPTTDSAGGYMIASLAPGTYFVLADPSSSQGFVDELYDDIPCVFCDVTLGTPVVVTSSGQTSGIDFALAKPGSLSGTVTDEVTGSPVASVFIEARNREGDFLAGTFSNADGTYSLSVPAGTAFVIALSSFVDELYDNVPCPNGVCRLTRGTPVTILAEVDTPNIDFALEQDGGLSGRVTFANTNIPLAEVIINVFDSAGNLVAVDLTDRTGTYFLFGLPAGSFFVTTTNYLGFDDELYQDLPCVLGACDPTTGTPIVIVPNAVQPDIDFGLGTVLFYDDFESGDLSSWISVSGPLQDNE